MSKALTIDPNLEFTLQKAASFHGHYCPGTVIGVRMGLAGLRELEITDPKGSQRKDLMVFVETDRCPVDAIAHVTGCKISNRNLKFFDWGKMASTFFNIKTGKAVRVLCPEGTRDQVDLYAHGEYGTDKHGQKAKAVDAYKVMPEDEIFVIQQVNMLVQPEEKVKYRVICESCGESVNDHRDVTKDGKVLCKPCATGETYFSMER
jgi:formylmethanofuran dehydrogenase subunit E